MKKGNSNLKLSENKFGIHLSSILPSSPTGCFLIPVTHFVVLFELQQTSSINSE